METRIVCSDSDQLQKLLPKKNTFFTGAKQTVFVTFLQLVNGDTPRNITAGEVRKMRCPTDRSTKIISQLVVPVKFKAPEVL